MGQRVEARGDGRIEAGEHSLGRREQHRQSQNNKNFDVSISRLFKSSDVPQSTPTSKGIMLANPKQLYNPPQTEHSKQLSRITNPQQVERALRLLVMLVLVPKTVTVWIRNRPVPTSASVWPRTVAATIDGCNAPRLAAMCTFGSCPFAEIELNGGSRFRDDLDLDGLERSVSSLMPGVCRRIVWMSCSSMDDIIIVRWWRGGGGRSTVGVVCKTMGVQLAGRAAVLRWYWGRRLLK
jgi:hypothetical protein